MGAKKMSKRDMPKCKVNHPDCFARTADEKCFCLSCTAFSDDCPFYKPAEKVKYLITAYDYREAKNK